MLARAGDRGATSLSAVLRNLRSLSFAGGVSGIFLDDAAVGGDISCVWEPRRSPGYDHLAWGNLYGPGGFLLRLARRRRNRRIRRTAIATAAKTENTPIAALAPPVSRDVLVLVELGELVSVEPLGETEVTENSAGVSDTPAGGIVWDGADSIDHGNSEEVASGLPAWVLGGEPVSMGLGVKEAQ